jgi:putative glutamine amidotransferase
MASSPAPSILVTLSDPERSHDPAAARLKNELYLEAVRRVGGEPAGIDESDARDLATAALAGMAGLLLSGGSDLDPSLYGAAPNGSTGIRRERDRLDVSAWAVATDRRLPVLGICRGLQAINVFHGGRITQHVDGHQGANYGEGLPVTHALRLVPGTRIHGVVAGDGEAAKLVPSLTVNSYHHQAVRPADLAPGLRAAGFSADGHGEELIEALEALDGRWVVGVQFHPERTDSTPPEFERLFAAFVEAARRGE